MFRRPMNPLFSQICPARVSPPDGRMRSFVNSIWKCVGFIIRCSFGIWCYIVFSLKNSTIFGVRFLQPSHLMDEKNKQQEKLCKCWLNMQLSRLKAVELHWFRYIAQPIQQETGGDLFSIETVQDYLTTHNPLLDFAYEEKEENARSEWRKNPKWLGTAWTAFDTVTSFQTEWS